ncbi:MAG: hypothetical protein ACUVWA_14205, partial [Candidatus Oleimicrobiaceae bacterium]
EDEFYDTEDYRGVEEFKAKAYGHQLYFNFKRKHRYKGRRAPIQILNKGVEDSISSRVFNLAAVILDNLHHELVEGGYRVGTSGGPKNISLDIPRHVC